MLPADIMRADRTIEPLQTGQELAQRVLSKKRVTRNDVAERARVSPSTVSYVINNGPRPVSEYARQSVLQAISELGYHPSDIARSLRTRRTLTIGLVIPDSENPFYGEVARAVEEVSFNRGYTVILGHSSHMQEREQRYAQVLRSKQVDGVIFHPVNVDLEPVHLLSQAGIQVVVLERRVPGFHCIVADEHNGGYLATRHLLDSGHTRIACVIQRGDPTSSALRVEGYRSALIESGLPPDESLIIESDLGFTSGEKAASAILNFSPLPTAVVAHNDVFAIASMKTFADAGLRMPEDISLVGFDDITMAAYTRPPLTTIAYPKHQMGRAAAELLLRLLRHEETGPPDTSVLPVHLVVRESTSPPRA